MKNLLITAENKIKEYGEIIIHYAFDNVRTKCSDIEYSNGFMTENAEDIKSILKQYKSFNAKWCDDMISLSGKAINQEAKEIVEFSKKYWPAEHEYIIA